MSDSTSPSARPTPVGRALFWLSSTLALIGGLIMFAVAVMTTISVTSRSTLGVPIKGDYELIAVGTGLAVFSFLPLCQLLRENVVVDVFLSKAPFRFRSFMDTIGNLLYGAIMTLVTWRTGVGGFDIHGTDESTTLLGLPYWTLFPYSVLCLGVLCIVCLYTVFRSATEVVTNHPVDEGFQHRADL